MQGIIGSGDGNKSCNDDVNAVAVVVMVKAMMMMTTMTIVVIIDDDNNDDGDNNYNKITICGRAGVVKGREREYLSYLIVF